MCHPPLPQLDSLKARTVSYFSLYPECFAQKKMPVEWINEKMGEHGWMDGPTDQWMDGWMGSGQTSCPLQPRPQPHSSSCLRLAQDLVFTWVIAQVNNNTAQPSGLEKICGLRNLGHRILSISQGQRKTLRKSQALRKPARSLNRRKWFNYQSVTKQIVRLIFGYLMLMVINITKIFLRSSVYI